MAHTLHIVSMLCGLLVLSFSSLEAQNRLALLIGNAAYTQSPLRNPVNDAADMATMLRRLGFEVTLLRDADKPTMERAIGDFTRGVPKGGIGLFYFSGHGVQIDGLNYLLPIGVEFTQPTDVKYHAVAADWILGRMDDTGMEVKLLILDACRNNPYGRSWSKALDRGLGVMDAPRGTLIAYATSPKKTASDGVGHNSPYTARLLREIPIPGRPIELVFKAVRLGVQQETQGEQTPWEASSLTGDFYFAPGEAPAVSTSPPSVTPLPPPTAPPQLPQPPVVTKPSDSSPPTPASIGLPAVQTIQDGPRGVDNPFRSELGVPSKITLEKNEVSYFLVSLPAGRFKVVLDTRQFEGTNANLQSALTITDVDGVVLKDDAIRFNAVDVAWRETYSFSLKQPMKTGFKLTNFHNKADFWLVVLPMLSPGVTEKPTTDEAESQEDDLRALARQDLSPHMRALLQQDYSRHMRALLQLGQAQKSIIEIPDSDEAESQQAEIRESDLKEYNPQMGKPVPFPFFGKIMPKLLQLEQAQKGTLNRGESAYYITLLPQGKYKVVVGFDNAKRRNTNIQGYLAFLHADGGSQKSVIDFNEVDVSARKSAEVICTRASTVVMRIKDNRDTINYSVIIRPAE